MLEKMWMTRELYTHLSIECGQDMIHTEGFNVLVISRGNPMLII